MNMKRINYKSDFDFILLLYSCLVDSDGKEVEGSRKELEWPDYDWRALIYTSVKSNGFTASCVGGVATNCYNDNGKIHVVVDGHHIGPGQLRVEFTAELSREIYPDGAQRKVFAQLLDIELVTGHGDCPSAAEAELLLPFIKGDKGDKLTYADLTEADKADLIAPIKKEVDKKADRTELSPVLSRDPEEELESVEPDFLTLMLRKNEQVLTDEERRQVLENLGRPDLRLFIDMFNEAAGDDGYARMDNGVFDCKLNGVPLTYEEAIEVYASYPLSKHRNPTRQAMFSGSRDKTLFPINADSFLATNYLEAFTGCHNLVAVKFITASNNPIVAISSAQNMFRNCEHLKYIYGALAFTSNVNVSGAFDFCLSLEEVRIKNLAKSLNLASSPKLSLDSVAFMVQNAANTSPITITLHTDVFAKLTGELLAAAAEKNITLTTP